DGYTEELCCDIGGSLPAGCTVAFARHGRARPDMQHARIPSPLPKAANQHGHVSALAATVRVQLVEHEELKVGGRPVGKMALCWPYHHVLQHDVVGQQDVRQVIQDALTGFVFFLARVFLEPQRTAGSYGGVSFEGLELAVDEGVHRVDDDGPYLLALRLVAQNVVANRNQIGKALAGARAGGYNVGFPPPCYFDGLALVMIQPDGAPVGMPEELRRGWQQ